MLKLCEIIVSNLSAKQLLLAIKVYLHHQYVRKYILFKIEIHDRGFTLFSINVARIQVDAFWQTA